MNEQEIADLNSVPIVIGGASSKPKVSLASHQNGKPITCTNLASYNFANLADDERIKERAIATLRSYGVGSCSPPGFYGTIGEFPRGKGIGGQGLWNMMIQFI